ncbi:MAG: FAD-dependent oxidoreductase [Verrucomicrobia bacterium]|nr:FAD-dependent oxidoreductase [Verrucomicrobiota bacterium]
MFILALALAGVLPGSAAVAAPVVLVEAESFEKKGGWVVDPQFMDIMGSPFLLAHGLGVPVSDAVTTVKFAATGTYRVWVRTRDWVATWKAPGAPGRFQLIVNGRPLDAVFGAEGAEWHWQDGGQIEIKQRSVKLALRDLTGFEGRCDAIVFAADAQFTPPNRDPEMARFRRQALGLPEKPEDAGRFDFVVTGGGIAGTCAAVSAARLGLKVAFIQDRPVLGGNNSSEVRVWLQGARNKEPWPRVGDIVAELEQDNRAHYGPDNKAELYEDEKKLAVVRSEKNICLFLNHRAQAVEKDAGRIAAVIATDVFTGRQRRFAARWFADCTGDGCVGALAGADFDMQPKGRMGPCNLWNVIETGKPVAFPRCPWALDLGDKPFPGRGRGETKPNPLHLGGWYWESGFDRDPIQEMEYVRDWNFRAMYGAWDALKNVDKVLPNHKLNWAAHIMGKRESRRLMGDVVLTKEDVVGARQFPDACAPTGWKIDLHLPDKRYESGFEGDAFISAASFGNYPMPFWIPYRCLYSRNVPNLFMAGRDVSVTHEALGAVRVMRTGGCMGEIVGMAASVCLKHDTEPRAVHERYFTELQEIMRRGVGRKSGAESSYENQGEPKTKRASVPKTLSPPPWLSSAGPNLARSARVTVSGSRDAAQYPPGLINNGRLDVGDNALRWQSEAEVPHWIEFAWDAPQTVSVARVVSGFCNGGGKVIAPIATFTLQFHDGAEWRDAPGAAAQGNERVDWHATFAPVTSARFRLLVTATQTNISRIWEVELYHPKR